MDKALKKINELKQKLEELYVEKDNIEDKIDFKNQDRLECSIGHDKLVRTKKRLENRKQNIEYKQSNLKKWKKQMIICTSILILISEFIIVGLSFSILSPNAALTLTLLTNMLCIPGCIFAGDVNNYKLHKKYLKEHKLENVEKELAENSKELEFSKKHMDKLNIELNNFLNTQEDILNNINLLESEIKNIKNIRATVIEEYIKDNQELDILINNEYEKENQKQLINKKDSNK